MALELRGVLYEITDEQLERLVEAIARHADGLLSQDPTIGCCWDADRLDLPRYGIRVDPTMLSTEAGRRKTRVVDRLVGHGDAGGRLGSEQGMRSVTEQNEDGIEAQNRLRMELVAAMEAEEEAGKRWHDLLFATIYREREPADPDQPFALAVALSEEGSSLAERVSPVVVDMAKTYVEAVTRRQEGWAMLQAEVAYSHPKHLDELNRERSLEEMERLLEDLRGYEDPPENP